VPVGERQFSIALGAGVITNPLNDGDNIPLIIVPNFSYYGEQVFIDNNALGFTLYESSALSFSAVSQINRENSFFQRWHPNNIFVNTLSNSIVSEAQFNEAIDAIDDTGGTNSDVIEVELDEVQKRKWALDAGLQVNWFFFQQSHLQVKLLHNINNVYNGLHLVQYPTTI
jgi:outer membrane protein